MIKIGVDIDGTIKHTQRAAVKIFNEALNREVKVEDVRTFHLDDAYGLNRKEGRRLWRELEPKIYSIGVPLENAATVLTQLAKEGHEIFFVTARPGMPHIEKITQKWLKQHGFPYNGRNLFMNAQNKALVAKRLGLELFFEDAPFHLNRLVEANIPTVIVDAVYNKDYDPSLPRIKDWKEVPALVREFAARKVH